MVSVEINQYDKQVYSGEIPEKYSELSNSAYRWVAYFLFSDKPIEESVVFLLWKITGIRKRKFFKLHSEHQLRPEDDSILDHLDKVYFAFKIDDLCEKESRIPRIGLFLGPKDYLSNIEVNEYGYADKILSDYWKSKEEVHIDLLVGCLYRLPFMRFDNRFIEAWTWVVKLFTTKKSRRAAFLNYMAMRNWWSQRYPKAFGGDETNQREVKFDEFMITISAGPFGTEPQVKRTKMKSVMTYLNKLGYDREEMERTLQKNKK